MLESVFESFHATAFRDLYQRPGASKSEHVAVLSQIFRQTSQKTSVVICQLTTQQIIRIPVDPSRATREHTTCRQMTDAIASMWLIKPSMN